MFDGAPGHRGRLDRVRLQRCGQAPPHTDETRGREHDERDKQKAEKKQPVRRPDRKIFAEENVEQCAERRSEQTAHAADDHHGEQLARGRYRGGVGRREAVVERKQDARKARQRGR